MKKVKARGGVQKEVKLKARDEAVSYRLKCVKTANGLSHFSMYGDVPKEKTVL